MAKQKKKASPKAKQTKKTAPKSKKTAPKTKKTAKKPTPRVTAKPAPKARKTAPTADGPVELGVVRVPSGTLGILDIGLVGVLPLEVLDLQIVKVDVPADRVLRVIGVPKEGRRAWDHLDLVVDGGGEPVGSKKVGEVAIDLGRIACMDVAALDAWQHDESLDGKADIVFRGRDAANVARIIGARRLVEGYGWIDMALADAETRFDDLGRKKSANKWQVASELRPHSHHHQIVTAIATSPAGSASLDLADTTLTVLAAGGEGVYPVRALSDADGHLVRITIQL